RGDVRWPAAADPPGPGARRGPGDPAVRRAAALHGPARPAGHRRAAGAPAAGTQYSGAVHHAQHHPDPRGHRPGSLHHPARAPAGHGRGGHEHRDPLGAVPNRGEGHRGRWEGDRSMSEFHTGQWWADTLALLNVDFVQQSILAALLLGVLSGAIAPIIVMRNMSFAAHSTGELALMGAAAALLFGFSISWGALLGAVCAAVILGVVGAREQDSIVAVVLSFGMGLSVLFIYLYPGRSSTAFSLLTGQIVGVSSSNMKMLAIMTVIVVAVIALLWRPLLFATADPTMAAASGVKVRLLSVLFAAVLGAVASQGVQIVGALLLLALLITPGAAAVKVTANPLVAVVLSAVFSVTAAVGGLVLSLAPGLPVSVFVTTLSFLIYLICWFIEWLRGRRMDADEVRAASFAAGSGLSGVAGRAGKSGAAGLSSQPGADSSVPLCEADSCANPENHQR